MHVVLHIGPHKTGSSSIQNALRKNVPSLERQGFLTSSDAEHAASALPLLFQSERAFHPKMRRLYPTWQQAQVWSEQHWAEMELAAKTRPGHVMILSSEHFASLADPSLVIARLRRTFDRITVVAYVRDPVDLYVSSIQQNIRGGRRLADLRIPSDFPYGIRRQIDRYAAAVGRSNVVVRNFARSNLAGGDVVLDFFAAMAGLGRPVTIASSFVNEAFPAPIVAWLLIMNEAYERVIETDERIALLARLDSIAELKTFPKLQLNIPEFSSTIRSKTREDCLWINQTYLQGQEHLRVEPPEPPLPTMPTAEREHLRQWILQALTPKALALLLPGTISLANPKNAGGPAPRTKAAGAAAPVTGNRKSVTRQVAEPAPKARPPKRAL